jgi:hypothetical protein
VSTDSGGRPDGAAASAITVAPDAIAELMEVAGVLRSQASRIAELDDEVERVRAAAEGARELARREATRRVEIQTELHAVHRTRVWRYSSLPRRLYGRLRLRFFKRGEAEPAA